MKYKFEKEIIDPILSLIKDNQEYLTKPENLPQLAKLGYMYNTLWYAGRVCLGYAGILQDKEFINKLEENDDLYEKYNDYISCENNPKYKIEECDPINEEIEDFIYDAWGMHVTNGDKLEDVIDFIKFSNLIRNGREYTAHDKLSIKPNKTFDEWVEVLTHNEYRYRSIFPDRRSVSNYLMCVIGTGFGFNKDGFIIREASGADQDSSIYGQWENAKFREDINKVVENILNTPEVKEVLNSEAKYRKGLIQKKIDDEQKTYKFYYKMLKGWGKYSDEEGALTFDEIYDRLEKCKEWATFKAEKKGEKEKKYKEYYPISNYSIIDKVYKSDNAHQSYINEGINICNRILENKEKEREQNVQFAKKYLKKFAKLA